MVGGPDDAVARLAPIFDALAPGVEAAERTPTSPPPAATPSTAERGWLHCGPNGAGHFVKMVHNGIEYGLMAAYAEGLNVLAKADIGAETHAADAETAPLVHPEYYRYDLDLAAITEVWRRGSVVASWLLDLTAEALAADPRLDALRRPRQRLRRGSLDDQRGDRRGRPGARAVGRPVPALQLAGSGRRRRQGAVGHARRFRWPRRAHGVLAMSDVVLQPGHQPQADALVLFGATGDLAKRKLFPALYHLVRRGELKVPIIGVARSDWTDDDFKNHARESVVANVEDADDAVLDDMCGRLDLIQGDYAAPETWQSLAATLDGCGSRDGRVLHGDPARHVPDGRREAGVGRPQQAGPHRRREAVRPRPRVGAASSTARCTRSSPRSASSASTTTSARRRSRTSSCSGSRTCCSSRCGTGTTCAACR